MKNTFFDAVAAAWGSDCGNESSGHIPSGCNQCHALAQESAAKYAESIM